MRDLKAPRLWNEESGWSVDFSRTASIEDFTDNNERDLYLIDLSIGIDEVLPPEAFDVDDGVEIYVLPGFPANRLNTIANAIGEQFLTLKELAENGISEQEVEDDIRPGYMSHIPNLPQVLLQIRVRNEDNNPVRLGSFSPRLTHKYEDKIDHIWWCNPDNEPVSLDDHKWVGKSFFFLRTPILDQENDDFRHVMKGTSCVLVMVWSNEDERNNFQVTHVPSSMSHQLSSFLDSLSQHNIHEKLDELCRNWISIPDPQAVMSCGLDKVREWYVNLPSLRARDWRDTDKMVCWVTVLYGSENESDNSKRWMNLEIDTGTKKGRMRSSFSKLKDSPCNRFLCTYGEPTT